MRFLLVSLSVVMFLLAATVVLVSRSIVPELVKTEKQQLVDTLPLVRSAVKLMLSTSTTKTPQENIEKIRNLSGLDITILSATGTVSYTTLEEGRLVGSTLAVGSKNETIFEMVAINETPSFVISTPLPADILIQEGSEGARLVLSKPDEVVGKFFDELFTNVIIVGLLGIGLSILAGFYQRSRTQSISFNFAPISEALTALARKDFNYRLRENVGDESFREGRDAFNRFMEEMAKGVPSPQEAEAAETVVRSSLVAGETDRRAFQTALGSVGEGIVIVEQSGKIVVFNRKMEELTGLDADVATNRLLTNVLTFTRLGGEQTTSLIPQILATGVSEVFPEDTMLRRRDGTLVPVLVKTVAIRQDLRGAVTHLVVVVTEKQAPGTKPIVIEKKPRSALLEEARAEAVKLAGGAWGKKAKPTGEIMPRQAPPSLLTPPPRGLPSISKSGGISPAPHSDKEPLPMKVEKVSAAESPPSAGAGAPAVFAEAEVKETKAAPRPESREFHSASEKLPMALPDDSPMIIKGDTKSAKAPPPARESAQDNPPPNLPV